MKKTIQINFYIFLVVCTALWSCKKKIDHTQNPVVRGNSSKSNMAPQTLNLLALADVNPRAFDIPYVTLDFIEIKNFSIPVLTVAFQGQDFFVYEYCNTKESSSPCPTKSQVMFYSPLNLDPGTYSVRVKTCVANDRTESGEIECGEYSDPMSVEMPSLDEESSNLLADYHNAIEDISGLSNEFIGAIDDYIHEVDAEQSCQKLDQSSWSSIRNFQTAGPLYFQEFLAKEDVKTPPTDEATTVQLGLTENDAAVVTSVNASYEGAGIKDGKGFEARVGGGNGLKALWEAKIAKTTGASPAQKPPTPARSIATGDVSGPRSTNLVALTPASLASLTPQAESRAILDTKTPSVVLTLAVAETPDIGKTLPLRIPFADDDFVLEMRKKQVLAEMNLLKETAPVTEELSKFGVQARKSFTFDDLDALMISRSADLSKELDDLIQNKPVTSQIAKTTTPSTPTATPEQTPPLEATQEIPEKPVAPTQTPNPRVEERATKQADLESLRAKKAAILARIDEIKAAQKALSATPPPSPGFSDDGLDPSAFDDARSVSTAASDPVELSRTPSRATEVESRLGPLLENFGTLSPAESERMSRMMDLLYSNSKNKAQFEDIFGRDSGGKIFEAFTKSGDPRRVKASLFQEFRSLLTEMHASGKLSLNSSDGRYSERIASKYKSRSIDDKMKILACAIYEHKVALVSDLDTKTRMTRAQPAIKTSSPKPQTHILEHNAGRILESDTFRDRAIGEVKTRPKPVFEAERIAHRVSGDIRAPRPKMGRFGLTDDTECPAFTALEAKKQKVFDRIKTLAPSLKAFREAVSPTKTP